MRFANPKLPRDAVIEARFANGQTLVVALSEDGSAFGPFKSPCDGPVEFFLVAGSQRVPIVIDTAPSYLIAGDVIESLRIALTRA